MNKILTFISAVVLTASLWAQAPNKMSFQTVVRNSLGKLVVNKSIGVRLSILKTSSTGTAVYVETHSKTSNVNGLLTLEVGTGTVTTGTFATINWAQGPYFLKTEMDVNGGTSYSITGVTEFVSVPYALSVKTLSNGANVGDMNYWNGTTWVPLNAGAEGQTLTFCGGKPTWTIGGVCPGTITALNCSSVTNNGTLTATTTASGVSSVISYTGGNGGSHSGQVVTSTGVTGLTATLQSGTFANGNGSLTYTITGTPSASGTASFTLNIGGKTCVINRSVVLPVGALGTLDCSTASHNGTLTAYTAASGITSVIPYTGGNGGTHNGQVVTSTGVTGLTATLPTGTFANGNGSITYTITGTPATSGTASFTLNIGGKTCVINRNVVLPVGALGTLDCANATNNGTLAATQVASGVTSIISYTGGNGGSHNGQVVTSTGVTGLTATLQAGTFANGNGNLTYTITGTPATSGIASFALNIGGKTCVVNRTIVDAALINFTSIGTPVGSFHNNVSDIDGNSYKTVQIGTQVWMAENLKVSKYSDGTTIPNITDNDQWSNLTTGAWCYYNNDAANNAKYGKLYNWYAVSPTTNGNKNICPTGWHVPTDAEWTVLTDYLGGLSVAGGKLKEVGTTSWDSSNTDVTNISLFTGLPGGYRLYNGNYSTIGGFGSWWSSSEGNTLNAWYRYLYDYGGNAFSRYFGKIAGFSVRCLRD